MEGRSECWAAGSCSLLFFVASVPIVISSRLPMLFPLVHLVHLVPWWPCNTSSRRRRVTLNQFRFTLTDSRLKFYALSILFQLIYRPAQQQRKNQMFSDIFKVARTPREQSNYRWLKSSRYRYLAGWLLKIRFPNRFSPPLFWFNWKWRLACSLCRENKWRSCNAEMSYCRLWRVNRQEICAQELKNINSVGYTSRITRREHPTADSSSLLFSYLLCRPCRRKTVVYLFSQSAAAAKERLLPPI